VLPTQVRERQKREGAAKIDWRFSNALERIRSGDFGEASTYEPLLTSLVPHNDQFLVAADFASYLEAQARVDRVFQRQDEWCRLSILCCAGMILCFLISWIFFVFSTAR
jgi:glucan phosphorylase